MKDFLVATEVCCIVSVCLTAAIWLFVKRKKGEAYPVAERMYRVCILLLLLLFGLLIVKEVLKIVDEGLRADHVFRSVIIVGMICQFLKELQKK